MATFSVDTSGSAQAASSTNAAASPVYTGTTTAAFIPYLWSGKILEKFYASTVLAAIANTDYEGEIKNQGDTVIIRTKPTLTVADYELYANPGITLQRPSSQSVSLTIDRAKYFAAVVDDVYEVQSDLDLLSMWADDAAEQMKIAIDTEIIGSASGGILGQAQATTNIGAAAGAISAAIDLGTTAAAGAIPVNNANIIQKIIEMGQVLDEQNVPESGRWIVMPAWAISKIKASEFRQAYLTGDGVSIARNGRVGMIDRFTVYSSNLLYHVTDADAGAGSTSANVFRVYAGHPSAITFASQLTKVETLRSESYFGTVLRGLQVFGFKVVQPTALVESVWYSATNA